MMQRELNIIRNSSAQSGELPYMDSIIAINENYMIRQVGTFLRLSEDYGKTWPKRINAAVVGDIRMVHVFTNGKAIVCGRTKAYYTDFTTIQESIITDIDGTPWTSKLVTDNFYNFNEIGYQSVGGTEMAVWGCYNNDDNDNQDLNTIIECYYTKDFGANIKVFFRSGVSTVNGWTGVVRCRHIHEVRQNPNDGTFWIQTGDEPRGTMSHWIKGTYNIGTDSWTLDHVGAGDNFKTTQIRFYGDTIYYTKDIQGGGLCKVKISEASDITKHSQILDIGTDAVGLVVGLNGQMLVYGSLFFNPNHDGRALYYSTDRVSFTTIMADLPSLYTRLSSFAKAFSPNSRGQVLTGISTDYRTSASEMELTPNFWFDKILERAGIFNAFK